MASSIKITYKNGGSFEVEADTPREVAALAKVALVVLWPNDRNVDREITSCVAEIESN